MGDGGWGEDPKGAKVQIGVQSTEYGVRRDAKTVRRCKSERCSCAKVERWNQITEYRVRRTEDGGKVGTWQDRVRSTEYRVRHAANGRDAVAPLPDAM